MKRMMKRLLGMTLCMLMLISLLPAGVPAAPVNALNEGDVYYVAGSEGLCGIEWTLDAPQNQMTQSPEGTWSITYTGINRGTYELKVTDGTWEHSWGSPMNGSMVNYVVNVSYDNSTVVITFDPVTKQISDEVTAIPETASTRKLTVFTRNTWDNVYAYTWEPETFGKWPGKAVEEYSLNLYEIEIPVDMTNLILSSLRPDGTRQQTDDILLEENGCDVVIVIHENAVYENIYGVASVPPYENVYRVVGNAPWMGDWDAAFDGGIMEEVEPNVYEKRFENVPPGDYEFKITQNGRWNVCWGSGFDNYKFSLETTSDVIVTFFLDDGEGYIQLSVGEVLMGDMSNDGKLNMGDVAKLYAYVRGTAVLIDEVLPRADMNGDGKINMGDVARLYSRVRGTDMAGIVDDAYNLSPGEELPREVTLKGKVRKVLDVYDPENQTISLLLEVPEREFKPITLYCLRGEGVDLIAENDTVTVKGRVTNFNGTIEIPYGTLVQRISGGGTPIAPETEPDKIMAAAHRLEDLEELPYDVTLSGRIISIDEAYSAEYQNISVIIAVDGTDYSLRLFRLKGDKINRLAVSDWITVVGRIQNYYGELELVRGTMIDWVCAGGTPPVVQTEPTKIVDEAYSLPVGEQLSYDATLEGKIVELVSPYDSFYWNMSVVIAVEGREEMPILCYRMTGSDIGNHLCIGDTITVTGRLKNYNGTIEFDAKCRMTDWKPGSIIKPTDSRQIVDAAFALGENETLPYFAALTGTVKEVTEPYSSDYRNITLVMTVQGTDGPHDIVCYRMKGEQADEVAVGDTITVSGAIKRFVREKDGCVEDFVEFDSGCRLEELHN
jgi:hypothetical protein